MNNFIKKNINIFIAVFILIAPILDLFTGISTHINIDITIGIIIRVIFLIIILLIPIFIFKKKKLIIPYLIIGLYFVFYILGIILFKNSNNLFSEIQGLIKVFYFPLLFISMYSIKEEITISKMTLFTTLFLYLIFIFIPLLFGIGYDTYEITKEGTLGFYNSANEISGIISILTPIMFIILVESKNLIPKIILILMYLIVILMMGTKTPLLSLIITLLLSLVYFYIKCFKQKKYTYISKSIILLLITIIVMIILIPKTTFYKNIEVHLNYLKVDNPIEVLEDEKLIDHFIFSQRLTFLHNKAITYHYSNTYQKLFGIGYYNGNKKTKMIEMDYFDIYYSHGIIGFLLFFIITLYLLYKILENKNNLSYERYMYSTSLFLIILLSFFTGHIITAPSVSLIVIIIVLSLSTKKKKSILFADKNMDIGGIESSQVNLINNLDYNKYKTTLILEEKRGINLNKLNKNVLVKELKVSDNKNIILRKTINGIRKLIFKILYYDTYDFSCCYTTYSYSCNKIAKIASKNNAFYVHSNYEDVYHNEKDFRDFFDSRKVYEYKKIIFVSNESKKSFLKYYKDLDKKTYVLNNFIDIDSILKKSEEKIEVSKNNNDKLFVFVGRLDDESKKLKRLIYLIKKIDNVALWIIGDGPDKKMYENYADNDKRIKFLGRKSNPYPYMRKSDYIVLTSDYEGFPVIYLEAILLNKEIITTIPTSDDEIDIKDYAHIISKDENEMVEEVKEIIKSNKKKMSIDLVDIQSKRIKKLEEIINL